MANAKHAAAEETDYLRRVDDEKYEQYRELSVFLLRKFITVAIGYRSLDRDSYGKTF